MSEVIQCSSPDCDNKILVNDLGGSDQPYQFCPECKKAHSLSVLKVQVEHEKPIREVILEARMFKTASGMADYLGVSFVSIYKFVKLYFNNDDGTPMSFQQFRRKYICKSNNCYMLNIKRTSYSRTDYILKKIRSRSKTSCSCCNSLEPGYIMTNCPRSEVNKILRGSPRIVKISDGVFALAPDPIILRKVRPIHFSRPKPVHF